MTAPHKATEQQWGIVRRRAKNDFPDSTDSVLLELAHRVAAMESQRNLVVDTITDLQGCVNQLEAAASASPATEKSSVAAPDHFPDTTESDVVSRLMEWAAHPGQEGPPSNPAAIGRFGEWLAREMPPGTVIGQPMHWAPRIVCAVLNACQEGETAPSPAPAGDPVAARSGLVERVLSQLPSGTDPVFARQALLEVAEWADQQGLRRTMRRLREEADR